MDTYKASPVYPTLRDQFAIEAMKAIIPKWHPSHIQDSPEDAREFYQIADAMLEARKPKPEANLPN